MLTEIFLGRMGWDSDVVFMHYGPTLKYYRTMLHRALNNRVALDYIPLQEQEVRKYMRRLAEEPSRFMEHIHLLVKSTFSIIIELESGLFRLAASIAIRITYGYRVNSHHDPFVQTAEDVMSAFADGKLYLLVEIPGFLLSSTPLALTPGRWSVEMFPLRENNRESYSYLPAKRLCL